ncbi:MAG TPA: aldehyde dehydrogenase [Ktedonobacter sp.]|nr:aldehyde dehydrogenase [Ktedonobacter sp.]
MNRRTTDNESRGYCMSISTREGSPQFPTVAGSIVASTQEEMDIAVQALQEQKQAWVRTTLKERIAILDVLIHDFVAIAPQWVSACLQAKGLSSEHPAEEWAVGPWPVLKTLSQLRQSIVDIESAGHPQISGPVTTRPDGQVIAQIFPQTLYDRILFTGVTAELWMEPEVTKEGLVETQAVAYRDAAHAGKVALVLAAGNVSSIAPLDILYKLFVEDQVVILKTNPVNEYLGPLIEEGFRVLIQGGFLRVVYGGASEGAYLCNHDGVDEIHITGSDKTFNAIVFGTGSEGEARRKRNEPLLYKRVTGELGNVSPVIVVPGAWSDKDIAYHAEHIVTMLTTNAGFNCNATRVIITHKSWPQREQLLQQIRKVLKQVPVRDSYYPGAQDRQKAFVAQHPDAEQIGVAHSQQLPWTLIADVDATNEDDICFTTEAFCGLFAETALDAPDTATYVDKAVTFANETLWGTLNATIIVSPSSLKDANVADAIERAVANLRYGTVGINYWAGIGFALGTTTWGAFPGHSLDDIQSGTGVVHNTLMFDKPQKSVIRAPFRITPTPIWFVTQGRKADKVFPLIVDLEVSPSPLKLPAILWAAIVG